MVQYPFAIVLVGKSAAAVLTLYAGSNTALANTSAPTPPAPAPAPEPAPAPAPEPEPEPALESAQHQHQHQHQHQYSQQYPHQQHQPEQQNQYQPPTPTQPATDQHQHQHQHQHHEPSAAKTEHGAPPPVPSTADYASDAARLAAKLETAQAALDKQRTDAAAAVDILKAELGRERDVSHGLREKVAVTATAATPPRSAPDGITSTHNTLEGMQHELAAALVAAASAEATANRLTRDVADANASLESSKAEVVRLNAALTTESAELAKTIQDYKTMTDYAAAQSPPRAGGGAGRVDAGGGGVDCSTSPPQSPVRFNRSRLPVRSPIKLTGSGADGAGGGGGGGGLDLQQMQQQLRNYDAVEAERRAKMSAIRRADIAEHNSTERAAEVAALETQLSTLQNRLASAGSAAVVSATASAAATTRSAADAAATQRDLAAKLEASQLRADAAEGKARVAGRRITELEQLLHTQEERHKAERASMLHQHQHQEQHQQQHQEQQQQQQHQQHQHQQPTSDVEWTPVKKAPPRAGAGAGSRRGADSAGEDYARDLGVGRANTYLDDDVPEDATLATDTTPVRSQTHRLPPPSAATAAVPPASPGHANDGAEHRYRSGGSDDGKGKSRERSRDSLPGNQFNGSDGWGSDDVGGGGGHGDRGDAGSASGLSSVSVSDGVSSQGAEDARSNRSADFASDGYSDAGRSTSTTPSSSGGWAALPPTWVPPVFGGTSPLAMAERADASATAPRSDGAGSSEPGSTSSNGGGGGGGGGSGGMGHAISRNAIRMGGARSWSDMSARAKARHLRDTAPITLPFGGGGSGQIDEARRLASARKPGNGGGGGGGGSINGSSGGGGGNGGGGGQRF